MELRPLTKENEPRFVALYHEAFPLCERTPMCVLRHAARKGLVELLNIEEEGFAGIAVVLLSEDKVLLAYVTIEPSRRGRGLGSKALSVLRERYRGRRLVVEIESPEDGDMYKLRRKRLYLRAGYVDTGLRVRFNGVKMEILCMGGMMDYAAYKNIYHGCMGRILTQFLLRYVSGPR